MDETKRLRNPMKKERTIKQGQFLVSAFAVWKTAPHKTYFVMSFYSDSQEEIKGVGEACKRNQGEYLDDLIFYITHGEGIALYRPLYPHHDPIIFDHAAVYTAEQATSIVIYRLSSMNKYLAVRKWMN